MLRTIDIGSETVESLRADLAAVVESGTARRAFEDMGPTAALIGGKTGTAQAFTDQDGAFHDATAWFVGLAPIDDPRWVVAVMVDEGGSGGGGGGPRRPGGIPTPVRAGGHPPGGGRGYGAVEVPRRRCEWR